MKNYIVTDRLSHDSKDFEPGMTISLDEATAEVLLRAGVIEGGSGGKAATVSGGNPVDSASGTLGPSLDDKKFADLVAIAADEGLALDPKIKSKADAIAAIIAHRTTENIEMQGQASLPAG